MKELRKHAEKFVRSGLVLTLALTISGCFAGEGNATQPPKDPKPILTALPPSPLPIEPSAKEPPPTPEHEQSIKTHKTTIWDIFRDQQSHDPLAAEKFNQLETEYNNLLQQTGLLKYLEKVARERGVSVQKFTLGFVENAIPASGYTNAASSLGKHDLTAYYDGVSYNLYIDYFGPIGESFTVLESEIVNYTHFFNYYDANDNLIFPEDTDIDQSKLQELVKFLSFLLSEKEIQWHIKMYGERTNLGFEPLLDPILNITGDVTWYSNSNEQKSPN